MQIIIILLLEGVPEIETDKGTEAKNLEAIACKYGIARYI